MPKVNIKPGKTKKFEMPSKYVTPTVQQSLDTAKKYAEIKKKLEALKGTGSTAAKRRRLVALEKEIQVLKKELADHPNNKINQYKNDLKTAQKSDPYYYMDPELRKAVIYIEKHCNQSLSQIKKSQKFLYRGTENTSDIFIGNPRTDREPMDASQAVQGFVDEYLKISGFKAFRSNSIFCTGNYALANRYGEEVYAIFPLDGFNFTWSMKQKDWMVQRKDIDFKGSPYNIRTNIFEWIIDHNEGIYSGLFNLFEKMDYWDDGFEFPSLSEWSSIMNKFISLQVKYPKLKLPPKYPLNIIQNLIAQRDVATGLKTAAKSFINRFGLINSHLDVALKTGHEIYIQGPYVAILVEEGYVNWLAQLKAYFFGKKYIEGQYD